jgi:hypothetical protein
VSDKHLGCYRSAVASHISEYITTRTLKFMAQQTKSTNESTKSLHWRPEDTCAGEIYRRTTRGPTRSQRRRSTRSVNRGRWDEEERAHQSKGRMRGMDMGAVTLAANPRMPGRGHLPLKGRDGGLEGVNSPF